MVGVRYMPHGGVQYMPHGGVRYDGAEWLTGSERVGNGSLGLGGEK